MSELVWIMYFADLAHSIKIAFVFLVIVSGCTIPPLFFEYGVNKNFTLIVIVFLLSSIASIAIPSKEVIYAYAGSKVIESQLEQANINGTIQNDIYLLIRKKIKDELVEVEGEK